MKCLKCKADFTHYIYRPDNIILPCGCKFLVSDLLAAHAELERLKNALPKTADGATIVPGVTVYWPYEKTVRSSNVGLVSAHGVWFWNRDGRPDIECFSTREAAEAYLKSKEPP